jgi:Adenylyl/Guanylyl and SMODS C-terminal sensor domain
MTNLAVQRTDNRFLIVDTLLRSIAEDLDIPPGKYKDAVERYSSVGKWLEGGDYPGTYGIPAIYVQGSFRLGTVVRPFREGRDADYDIDLACELRSSVHSLTAEATKQMVGRQLKAHGTYREMLEDEGRRCWTLNYAEQDGVGFHLDALPCVPHPIVSTQVEPRYGQQAIGLTNCDKPGGPYAWGYSNPNGFADWFADRQRQAFNRVAAIRKQELARHYPTVFASVAEVPDQLVRTPLQRAVQLLKRHRDVRFSGLPEEKDKPISIIITTLAAMAYEQETDVFTTLGNLLDKIQRYHDTGIIRCVDGKWTIPNPTNPGENFADRWNEEGSRKPEAFFGWLDWLREDLDDLLNSTTHRELDRVLRKSFGDSPARRVSSDYSGPLPGAYQPASSGFGRAIASLFRFDVAHREQPKWHVQPSRYSATVKARYRRNGFRPTPFRSNSSALPKHVDLDFEVDTNVPKPFKVHWQVVNTGEEAYRAGQLRGDFYDSSSSGRSRTESTAYRGMHWVEGFVVKDGVCVARTGEFVVNIA